MLLRSVSSLARTSPRVSRLLARSMSAATTQRHADFGVWDDKDKAFFEKLLSPQQVLTKKEDTQTFTTDWMKKVAARSPHQMVLEPTTTEQVSAILKHCNDRHLAVVPQGGNTGLVGGSVPVFDEIVVSTRKMNKVISFNDVSGTLVCEAGCILQELDHYVKEFGYMMPLDVGSKKYCHIGGNLAANAGGMRLLRYGSLHGTVLGVEAVLADGTIIDALSTMRKDNTGYDLKQLFIGSEGTLGLITKVSIVTPPRPQSVNVAFLGCKDYDAVQRTFVGAKRNLGEILSAIEFIDRHALDMVLTQYPETRDPLPSNCPFYILIETNGSNIQHDREKLNAFVDSARTEKDASDGLVCDEEGAKKLFGIRWGIGPALAKRGYIYKYDISLPTSQAYKIVEELRQKLTPLNAEVIAFGHMGDGNLHLNISTLEKDDRVKEVLEPFVFEWTAKVHGAISAEHGIGTHKPPYLHLSKTPNDIALMRKIKATMDPNGILNPYKVLPEEAPAASHL